MSQRESPMMSSMSSCSAGLTGIVAIELRVEVAREDFDVTRLVHDLRRRVVLGVDPRCRGDDLGCADQSALLAVEELAHPPVEASTWNRVHSFGPQRATGEPGS